MTTTARLSRSRSFRTAVGLTKREFFALAAMRALLAGPEGISTPENIAWRSVMQADALLAGLAKEQVND